jgi:hypothetical protein
VYQSLLQQFRLVLVLEDQEQPQELTDSPAVEPAVEVRLSPQLESQCVMLLAVVPVKVVLSEITVAPAVETAAALVALCQLERPDKVTLEVLAHTRPTTG